MSAQQSFDIYSIGGPGFQEGTPAVTLSTSTGCGQEVHRLHSNKHLEDNTRDDCAADTKAEIGGEYLLLHQ